MGRDASPLPWTFWHMITLRRILIIPSWDMEIVQHGTGHDESTIIRCKFIIGVDHVKRGINLIKRRSWMSWSYKSTMPMQWRWIQTCKIKISIVACTAVSRPFFGVCARFYCMGLQDIYPCIKKKLNVIISNEANFVTKPEHECQCHCHWLPGKNFDVG